MIKLVVFLGMVVGYLAATVDVDAQFSPENKEINAETVYQVKLDLKVTKIIKQRTKYQ